MSARLRRIRDSDTIEASEPTRTCQQSTKTSRWPRRGRIDDVARPSTSTMTFFRRTLTEGLESSGTARIGAGRRDEPAFFDDMIERLMNCSACEFGLGFTWSCRSHRPWETQLPTAAENALACVGERMPVLSVSFRKTTIKHRGQCCHRFPSRQRRAAMPRRIGFGFCASDLSPGAKPETLSISLRVSPPRPVLVLLLSRRLLRRTAPCAPGQRSQSSRRFERQCQQIDGQRA